MEDKIYAAVLGIAALIVLSVFVAGAAIVIVTEQASLARTPHCEVISK